MIFATAKQLTVVAMVIESRIQRRRRGKATRTYHYVVVPIASIVSVFLMTARTTVFDIAVPALTMIGLVVVVVRSPRSSTLHITTAPDEDLSPLSSQNLSYKFSNALGLCVKDFVLNPSPLFYGFPGPGGGDEPVACLTGTAWRRKGAPWIPENPNTP